MFERKINQVFAIHLLYSYVKIKELTLSLSILSMGLRIQFKMMQLRIYQADNIIASRRKFKNTLANLPVHSWTATYIYRWINISIDKTTQFIISSTPRPRQTYVSCSQKKVGKRQLDILVYQKNNYFHCVRLSLHIKYYITNVMSL